MASDNTLKLRTPVPSGHYCYWAEATKTKPAGWQGARNAPVVVLRTHPRLAKLFRVDPPRKPAPKRPKRVPHRPIPTNPLTGMLSAPLVGKVPQGTEEQRFQRYAEVQHAALKARNKRKAQRRARKAA